MTSAVEPFSYTVTDTQSIEQSPVTWRSTCNPGIRLRKLWYCLHFCNTSESDLHLLGRYILSNTLRNIVEDSHAGSTSLRRQQLLDPEVEVNTILPNSSSKSTSHNVQKDETSSTRLSEPHISDLRITKKLQLNFFLVCFRVILILSL
jgi:hypothetical protein